MQHNAIFESLQYPGNMQTLHWELPLRKSSYTCPFQKCGDLVKPHPLDTPPRSFRELAEVRWEPLQEGLKIAWLGVELWAFAAGSDHCPLHW